MGPTQEYGRSGVPPGWGLSLWGDVMGKPRPSKEVAGRPVVEMSYGMTQCLYCKRTFEKKRAWAKYDTNYCRMMHWHLINRRKTEPGQIVRVDGETLSRPVLAIDPRLDREAEMSISALGSWGKRKGAAHK